MGTNFDSTSSRENPSAVWVRSLVPNEKKSACARDQVGDEARPGQLDHRPHRVVLALAHVVLVAHGHDQRPRDLELVLVGDERDHDLGMGRLVDRLGRAHDRVDLHLVDLGIQDAEPDPARAEHRVALVDLLHPREQLLELVEVVGHLDPRALDLGAQIGKVGQELVQRRVEQADRHRQPLHRLEDSDEVLLLERQQLGAAPRAGPRGHRP